MATIFDVAEKAGVSITTVSRVLNGHPHVREDTRRRVNSVLKELHFIPNTNARGLVQKETRTIAVIVPDITNRFFTTLLKGIEEKASENGFVVLLGNSDENIIKEQTYIQTFLERRVDGIIIDPVEAGGKNLRPVLKQKLPLVLVDREIPGLQAQLVTSDNERAARDLIRHLLALDHRRIGMLTGPPEHSVFRQRVDGYRIALAEAGIPLLPELIRYGFKPGRENGRELMNELLGMDPRPTAVFAANNFLATGAVQEIREQGLTVPEDVAVVCFDEPDTEELLHPFFTAMTQPVAMMGRLAMELLLRQMSEGKNEPTRVILESELRIRDSCGAKKAVF